MRGVGFGGFEPVFTGVHGFCYKVVGVEGSGFGEFGRFGGLKASASEV